MSGIRGQKWAEDKLKPRKYKHTIQLSESEMTAVKKIAEKNEWSIAKTLHKILIGDLPAIK